MVSSAWTRTSESFSHRKPYKSSWRQFWAMGVRDLPSITFYKTSSSLPVIWWKLLVLFLRVFGKSGTGGFLVQSGEMMWTTSNSARMCTNCWCDYGTQYAKPPWAKSMGRRANNTWTGTQIIWWVLGRVLRVWSMNQCCAALWIFKELLVLVL